MRAGALLLLLACAAAGARVADGGPSVRLPLRRRRAVDVPALRRRALLASGGGPSADATAQLPLDANAWGQGCVGLAGAHGAQRAGRAARLAGACLPPGPRHACARLRPLGCGCCDTTDRTAAASSRRPWRWARRRSCSTWWWTPAACCSGSPAPAAAPAATCAPPPRPSARTPRPAPAPSHAARRAPLLALSPHAPCSRPPRSPQAPQPKPGFAQGAFFNSSASATFRPIPCLSFDCVTQTCALSADVISAEEGPTPFGAQPLVAAQAVGAAGLSGALCGYFDMYADGSTSQGALADDVLALGAVTTPVLFGCETGATGNTYAEELDGIMGLGLGDQSVVTQLSASGAMADAFAICLGPIGAEYTYAPAQLPWQAPGAAAAAAADAGTEVGAIVFGQMALDAADDVLWSPLVRSLSCWTSYLVSVTAISVGPTNIAAYSVLSELEMQAQYAQRCGGTIIDSGSSFMYLPSYALAALTDAIADALTPGTRAGGCPPAALGGAGANATCYLLPPGAALKAAAQADDPDDVADGPDLNDAFPLITISLGGGASLAVRPENYLFPLGAGWPGVYVLGVYDSGGEGAVLGAITMAETLVVFDRAAARVGFRNGTTDCAAFAAGAGAVPEPPPAPPRRGLRNPLPIGAVFVIPVGAQLVLAGGALVGFLLGWLFDC
jgi:hypothetical protein